MRSLRQRDKLGIRLGLTLFVGALAPTLAQAAWLGYKNNTTAVVVIQATDVVVTNGQMKTGRVGKAHLLYPGEVAWDPVAAPGPRLISVYDPKQNNRLVVQDRVDCNKNDLFISLQLVQPPAVRGQPQAAPQPKLLGMVLPAQAPSIMSPGSMPTVTPNQPAVKPPTTPNAPPISTPPSNSSPKPPSR